MTYRSATAIAALLTGFASPSLALDFGSGFSVTGEFELEYFDSSGSSGNGETLGYGTVDFTYQQDGGGFGAFVGFDAVTLNDLSETAIYGAISYSGDWGKVQIGVPRAALDDYVDMPALGGLRIFDLEFGSVNGSILTSAYLLSDLDTPVGLRYDGEFGATMIGASYHSVDDADIFDLGANYQLGNVVLRAGIEHLSFGGTSGNTYSLGANATFGKVEAGVLVTDTESVGDLTLVQLFATYSPIEQLNLTATAFSIDSGSDTTTLYGLAADYTFGQGVYVEAGVADGDTSGSLYNVSLGVKF